MSDFTLVVTQVPFTFINLYGGSIPKIPKLCGFWIYCTYTLYCVSDFLTMFATIQRYLLVFHKAFYMKWKVLTHYCTLLFCCLYPPIYYLYFTFFFPCVNNYDYSQPLCGEACFTFSKIAVLIDYFGNILLPVLTIVVVNFMLLMKVILLKRRMASKSTSAAQDQSLWKKNRRMIVQLMTIATATSLSWLPFIICAIADTFNSSLVSGNLLTLLNFLPYFNCMLTPFLAVSTISKQVTIELFQLFSCCRWKGGAETTATVQSTQGIGASNIKLERKTANDGKSETEAQ